MIVEHAGFRYPVCNVTSVDRFTHRVKFYFDVHARELRKLIERRGRESFRQQSAGQTRVGLRYQQDRVKRDMPNLKGSKQETQRIFVLADTHNRLPEKVIDTAKGADEIWHLGDVCAEAILDELRAIGPRVIVVRGNCDSNSKWPLVMDLERAGLKLRLQHIPPERPPTGVDVVLHGLTHVPRYERRGSVLFLNTCCVARA